MSSDGERAFKTLLIQLASDLPQPHEEYLFKMDRKWAFDFAWPVHGVAVEINGGRWKAGGGRHNTPDDYHKMQTAAALGWRVFPVLPEQLINDPHTVFALLREALGVKEHV